MLLNTVGISRLQAGEDVKDNMELFKQFQDNPSFKQWLSDTVFALTYRKGASSEALRIPASRA